MRENPSLSVVADFVDELAKAGVRHVCVSPGSRSTPLTMAFARHGGFRLWSLLDERSAAYFALGLSRVENRPAALVCTSGTATANYFPAIMEACQASVPLIVLTADRPPELHGVGANQTVDQSKLYGTYVKWYAEMPVPEDEPLLHRHARATARRLTAHAVATPAGPVHLNWPLREPLIPPAGATRGPVPGDGPAPGRVHLAHRVPDPAAVQQVKRLLCQAHRPLIVAGPQDDPGVAAAIVRLASAWDTPVLADPLSQVRTIPEVSPHIIDLYDALLRDPMVARALRPDLVLRFGRTPTSKVLGQFLSSTAAPQIVVTPGLSWHDPFFTATEIVESDPALFVEQLLGDGTDDCRAEDSVRAARETWVRTWVSAAEAARQVVNEFDDGDVIRFEGRVFLELARRLPADSLLFVGNSMPVRDMDTFFPKLHRPVRVLANRGASGIDGVVSTALGAAAAWAGRTVLVIGDVSFYHDFNSLLNATRHGIDLTVVLIHNDGGGIFQFLPQAGYPDTFDQFRTPHGLDFEAGVHMFGGVFRRARTWRDFGAELEAGMERRGLTVLEVRTDPNENTALHGRVLDRIADAVRRLEGPW